MLKRVISTILCLNMFVSMLPVRSFATEDVTEPTEEIVETEPLEETTAPTEVVTEPTEEVTIPTEAVVEITAAVTESEATTDPELVCTGLVDCPASDHNEDCLNDKKAASEVIDKVVTFDFVYEQCADEAMAAVAATEHRYGTVYAPYTHTNDSSKPYSLVDGIYYSTNHTKDSVSTYTITANFDTTLSLNYGVSSETNFDEVTLKHNGSQIFLYFWSRQWIFDLKSGPRRYDCIHIRKR